MNILNRQGKISTAKAIIVGVATGLYPILFYYSNNFSLINSLKHFAFFVLLFLCLPIILNLVIKYISKKSKQILKYQVGIFTFINLFLFSLFIFICLYARIPFYFILISLVIATIGAFLLKKQLGKLVVFQYLLAFVGLFYFVPRVHGQLTYSEDWKKQPDQIEQVILKHKPNVYYIQTDGYVNFSEITTNPYYQYNNDSLKQFLLNYDFTIYPDIRSNYTATLESNMATFVMKHHYYNYGYNFSEMTNARETIITKNPVLDIFKNNGYKTYFLAEWPYLIANLPQMGYDYCNFSYSNISLISEGFKEKKEIFTSLQQVFNCEAIQPSFYFMEILDPGHVATNKTESKGKSVEKERYFTKLKRCNDKLKSIIGFIVENDPDALIMIMADHGGYVGLDYMLENRIKTEDRDLLYSFFSTQFSIKWPRDILHKDDINFKTAVNTFRVLFSILSDNKQYLKYLEENASYTIINEGAPKGIYKVLDSLGNPTFVK